MIRYREKKNTLEGGSGTRQSWCCLPRESIRGLAREAGRKEGNSGGEYDKLVLAPTKSTRPSARPLGQVPVSRCAKQRNYKELHR